MILKWKILNNYITNNNIIIEYYVVTLVFWNKNVYETYYVDIFIWYLLNIVIFLKLNDQNKIYCVRMIPYRLQ